MTSKILEIKNLSKSFPGVKALDSINFDLQESEIHCIVGENGAGKSTFIKILSGAYTPDEGTLDIFGNRYLSLTPEQAINLGIQTVYQESVLVPTMSVSENIFLGNEKINKYGMLNLNNTYIEAQKQLDKFNIGINPKSIVEDLSTAEKQLIGIVKALSRKAKILILDEPTASLSSNETDKLLNLLKEIKKEKIGIIYISHHLQEVFRVGDRITVLKDGKLVNTHSNEEINQDLLIKEMIGRPASLFYSREKIKSSRESDVLEVKNFGRGKVVKDVSFTAQSGKIFGIGGMVGSGRTELVRMLVGVDRKDSGTILLNKINVTPNAPLRAIRKGICLISESRQRDGLVLTRSVKENISLPAINISTSFFINLRKEYEKTKDISKKLHIIYSNIDQEVSNLSGGNQQKVVLAKWLYTDCSIFIFDEPTIGVDIGAKEEIYKIMVELLKQNKIIIMVSSDMPELLSMSDKIGIMREGKMVKILENKDITEEKILSYSIGTDN